LYHQAILHHHTSNKLYLRWVDLALDDVQYRDVAMGGLTLDGRRDHHVLWLQQTSHDIKNRRLAYTRHLTGIHTLINGHFPDESGLNGCTLDLLSPEVLKKNGWDNRIS